MRYLSIGQRGLTLGRHLLATALVVAMTPAFADTGPGTDAGSRDRAAVREAFSAWAEGRGHVFDLLSRDVRWTVHGSGPYAGTYRGLEDFTKKAAAPLVSRLATPLKPVVHHIWAADDRIIIRFEASAQTTSGAPYRNQYLWIFRMDQGTVVEAEAFLDLAAYEHVVDNNDPRQP